MVKNEEANLCCFSEDNKEDGGVTVLHIQSKLSVGELSEVRQRPIRIEMPFFIVQ